MKLSMKHDVEVCCDKCHHVFTLTADKFRYASYVCDKRSLGNEYEHVLGQHGKCPECQSNYVVDVMAYEYPLGCINWEEEDVKGVSLRPGNDLSYERDKC